MWTITQHGFTSVVAYDARKDKSKTTAHKKIAPNPGTHLLVRARVEEDLEVLRSVCPNLVIETDPHADYAYRAVISIALFKQYMCSEIDQITYGAHFKEEFRANAHDGTKRYRALMDFWQGHASWQRFVPYTGTDRWAKGYKPKSHWADSPLPDDITGQTSMFGEDDGWADYDAAEAAGHLQTPDPVTVDRLKALVMTSGFTLLSLSDWANMDKDAMALAERLEELDDPDDIGREDLDAMALQVVWENSTDAEKEIWVDAGADLPQTAEALEEVDEIARRLANKG